MEFKGTKGKWHATFNWSDTEIEIGTETVSEIAIINKDCYSNDDEAVANALLISKATEMLDLLKKVVEQQHLLGCITSEAQKEIIQLIKEATEI